MVPKTVLVVEDEVGIRDMLTFNLGRSGYNVLVAADGNDARVVIANGRPDVILMDWMLSGVSGLELTRQLKHDSETKDIPIIMVTARALEDDRVIGLDSGADDYITKPFSPRELEARIKAVLRRFALADNEIITVGELKLDKDNHRVTFGENKISLAPTEFRLLEFFMNYPNRAHSRSRLLDRIWGAGVYVDERTVDVHIRRLRKALTEYGYDRLIQTVRGTGYRFSPGDV